MIFHDIWIYLDDIWNPRHRRIPEMPSLPVAEDPGGAGAGGAALEMLANG